MGDAGLLDLGDLNLKVRDTRKKGRIFVHIVEPSSTLATEELTGRSVIAQVDPVRRKAISRHHTATHLLQAALRQVLGPHVAQSGSYVSDELLRFDFTHGKAMTPEEIEKVEAIVNAQTWRAQAVTTYEDTPIEEARAMGATALFGEKYADKVRVVQIGDMPASEPSFSRELCGGIHVSNTGEIGLVKILHEGSVASGVRRITAVAGEAAYRWIKETESQVIEAAALLKANPSDLIPAINRTLETLKDERKKREKLASRGAGPAESFVCGPVTLAISRLNDADADDLKNAANRLADQGPDRVALIVSTNGPKLMFAIKANHGAITKGAHAGNLIREVAKAAGGGGGGHPDFATAGGKDPAKLDEAIEVAKQTLAKL